MQPYRKNLPPQKPPYVPKVTKSVILVCTGCASRFIKTRKNQQTLCIKCFVKADDALKILGKIV